MLVVCIKSECIDHHDLFGQHLCCAFREKMERRLPFELKVLEAALAETVDEMSTEVRSKRLKNSDPFLSS